MARVEAANRRCIEKDDELAPIKAKLQDSLDRQRQLARDLTEAL
jgi:hypothetical protein